MNATLLLSVASRHFSTCKLLLTTLGLPDAVRRQLSSVATASAWVAAADPFTNDAVAGQTTYFVVGVL